MTAVEIVLLIIGVVMMVASFFIAEKLSNQDLDKVAELSTEEMQRILERSLNDAQVKVDNMVDQVIDHSIEKSMEVVERALDKPMRKCGQLQNILIRCWNLFIRPIMKLCFSTVC